VVVSIDTQHHPPPPIVDYPADRRHVGTLTRWVAVVVIALAAGGGGGYIAAAALNRPAAPPAPVPAAVAPTDAVAASIATAKTCRAWLDAAHALEAELARFVAAPPGDPEALARAEATLATTVMFVRNHEVPGTPADVVSAIDSYLDSFVDAIAYTGQGDQAQADLAKERTRTASQRSNAVCTP
jgi:hypothetical protein